MGAIQSVIDIFFDEDLRIKGSGKFVPDEPYKDKEGYPVGVGIVTQREKDLSALLSHELGHAEYVVENPLLKAAWDELEVYYNQNKPKNWNYKGSGHLKGNPTGNRACYRENQFEKSYYSYIGHRTRIELKSIEKKLKEENKKTKKYTKYIADTTLVFK